MSVTINRLLPDSAAAFYNLIDQNRDHLGNMTWAPTATLQSTHEHLMRTRDLMWGVYVENILCGCVSLRPIGPDSYMIGYWLTQECQGHGVIAAAAQLMLDAYFVGYARMQTVVAMTRPKNHRSQRVLAKLGFTQQDQFLVGWFNYIKEIGK